MMSMSLEKRLRMRPRGVVSKKDMGERKIPKENNCNFFPTLFLKSCDLILVSMVACSLVAALRQATEMVTVAIMTNMA